MCGHGGDDHTVVSVCVGVKTGRKPVKEACQLLAHSYRKLSESHYSSLVMSALVGLKLPW